MRIIRSKRLELELRRAAAPAVALVIVATAALFALGFVLTNQVFQRPWDNYLEINADIADAKGILAKKQEVRIAGVRVGLIKDVRRVANHAQLTLAVEGRYAPVYRDARLRVRPQTALEDKFVELDRGTQDAGKLADGDLIPLSRTAVPVDASRVLQTFSGETGERLRFMLAGLGEGLDDGGASLRLAFQEAGPLLEVGRDVALEINERRVLLRRLVSRTARISQAIGVKNDALTQIVRGGSDVLTTLGRHDVPLGPTLEELPRTLAHLRTAFTGVRAARRTLDPALESLRPALARLEPALAAIEDLSGDLEPAARALQPAVTALDPLARATRPLARDLESALTQLRPQVPDLDLATRQFDSCKNAFNDFFVWTTSLFKVDDDSANGGKVPVGRGDITAGPPVLSHRRGLPPEEVGSRRQEPLPGATQASFGNARRTQTCTEAGGTTTFKDR